MLEGGERPAPQPGVIATLFAGLAALGFQPTRSWVQQSMGCPPACLLHQLSCCMADSLPQAKPAELAGWAHAAAQLGYVPSPPALQALLAWLSRQEEPARQGSGAGAVPQLLLQRFSSCDLARVVSSVCTFLRAAAAACRQRRQPLPVAPELITAFFDAVDDVLGMRLGLSGGVDPRALPEALKLTPGHVGQMLEALSRVPCPGPLPLSADTLDGLAAHCVMHQAGYDGHTLPFVLAFLAAATNSPGAPELPIELTTALAQRTGALVAQEQSLTLSALAIILRAAVSLRLPDRCLLGAIVRAVTAHLTRHTFFVAPPCKPRDVALLAAGTAQLVQDGQMLVDDLAPNDVSEFWQLLMRAADAVVRHTPVHIPVFSTDEVALLIGAADIAGPHMPLPPSVACLLPPHPPEQFPTGRLAHPTIPHADLLLS